MKKIKMFSSILFFLSLLSCYEEQKFPSYKILPEYELDSIKYFLVENNDTIITHTEEIIEKSLENLKLKYSIDIHKKNWSCELKENILSDEIYKTFQDSRGILYEKCLNKIIEHEKLNKGDEKRVFEVWRSFFPDSFVINKDEDQWHNCQRSFETNVLRYNHSRSFSLNLDSCEYIEYKNIFSMIDFNGENDNIAFIFPCLNREELSEDWFRSRLIFDAPIYSLEIKNIGDEIFVEVMLLNVISSLPR